MPRADDAVLYDVSALLAADPGELLRATASAGAQLRRGTATLDEDALARIAVDGRPRSVVVAGSGTTALSGEVLAAVAGIGCPVPIQILRGPPLPGWVGPLDLVIVAVGPGDEQQAVAIAASAARRGCRLVGLGAADSAVAEAVIQGGGSHLIVDQLDLPTRACLWAYVTPLLHVGHALRLLSVSTGELAATADALDALAEANGVTVLPEHNRAKTLAMVLAESLPVFWGDSPVAVVAAHRAALQLSRNARIPCQWGGLPDVLHHQAAMFEGPYGVVGGHDDLFRDPFEDDTAGPSLQLVLVRDPTGNPDAPTANFQQLRPQVIETEAGPPVLRLATLIGLLDWASVYTALALGIDPDGPSDSRAW
jgi:glucose/mannose-6-phosphate isomerase